MILFSKTLTCIYSLAKILCYTYKKDNDISANLPGAEGAGDLPGAGAREGAGRSFRLRSCRNASTATNASDPPSLVILSVSRSNILVAIK